MKYIKQRSKSDCAAACLCMIAWQYGKKLPYTEVSETIGIDKTGSTIYGVCEAAEKYQLHTTALQGSCQELCDDVKSGQIKLPIIARIVNRHQQTHFVVVTKIFGNKITVYDPDMEIGKKTFSISFFEKIFLGEIIMFEKTEDFVKENRHKNPLISFFKYAFKQKVTIASTFILSLIVSGIGILSSLILKFLVDGVFQANTLEAMDESLDIFAVLITGMALLYIVRYIMQLIRGRLSAGLAAKINQQLISDVYQKMMDLPIRFFGNKETGEILSRYSDASKINQAISQVILSVGMDLIMFVGAGITMYYLSPVLLKYSLFIIGTYLFISICFIKPLEMASRNVIGEGAMVNSYIKETTDGILSLKSCNAVKSTKEKFKDMFTHLQKSSIHAVMKNINKNGLIELFSSIGILALLWIGAVSIMEGNMTMGTMITVYSMLGYFFTPVQSIIEMQQSLQEAYIAAERLEDIYDSTPEEQNIKSTAKITKGNIRFDHVSYRYPNSDLVFDNLSFQIEQGSTTVIVGDSGCGKSTAAKLMTKFYTPESGIIQIDNHNINEYSLEELRQNIVYVPQEVFLFSDTLRNNLTIGIEREVTDQEIWNVLKICDCGFLDKNSLDFMVEENGSNFSGGQLKRIALARALLRKPKVLILDETTANLDSKSVQKITANINNLPITKIWITHDPDSIRRIDNIIQMKSNHILSATA